MADGAGDATLGGFLGSKLGDKWQLSAAEYYVSLICIIVVLVLIVLWLLDKFKAAKDPKVQGMTPSADNIDYLHLTGMAAGGGIPSSSAFGVRGDPVWGDLDSKLLAASRGVAAPSQGMMSGRGQELPMFLSSAQVNQMSQSEQNKLARGDDYVTGGEAAGEGPRRVQGFRTTKPLQGMSGDKTLEGILRGEKEGRSDVY